MKLEVIDAVAGTTVKTYVVADISMFSFAEWKDKGDFTVPLDQLLSVAANVNSSDPETGIENTVNPTIDLYLPCPLKDSLLQRLSRTQADTGGTSTAEGLGDTTEQVLSPPLKQAAILLAVVEEITRNHSPRDAYVVRMSDE